ncbi:MAG: DUF4442 domain-containing protein [bacterium]
MKTSTIYRYAFNLSPMYRRTTAKIVEVSDDLHFVKIQLKPSWKNKNYVGTIFGGSMLAATDPIYMIQLLQILGDDYVVWDKAVEAQYKRPAKSKISGVFEFSPEEISDIKKQVAQSGELNILKTMYLQDSKQNIIATFKKTVYVAQKSYYKQKQKEKRKN